MPGEVGADAVRTAALAVLEGDGTREGAKRLADDIAAMPPPAEVAALLRERVR
jgi:hypothetical protein